MNKGDLINKVADSAKISNSQAGEALNAVLDSIAGAVKSGDKVAILGFGTFSTSDRPAREARNPQTGKTVSVPAKRVVKFKPGKELAEGVN